MPWLLATDVLALSGRNTATFWNQRNPTREKNKNDATNPMMKQLKPEKIQRISCPAFLKFKNLPACYFLLQAWFSSDLTDIFPNDLIHTGPDWFCYPTSLPVRQHFTDSRILIEITTALVMVISREMGSSDRQPLAGTGRPTTALEVGDTATRQSAYKYTA